MTVLPHGTVADTDVNCEGNRLLWIYAAFEREQTVLL